MGLTQHNADKLKGCHPLFIAAVTKVIDAMSALGFPMIVTDGVRTTAEQQVRYAQGRTTSGPIVTNADGVYRKSNHQVQSDGYGHACDCAFLDLNGQPSWDIKFPWRTYGACAEALGLAWGGGWVTLHDLPHIELSSSTPIR